MKPICEVCHKEEATGTIWIDADKSPIYVGGVYQVCPKHGGPEKKKEFV